MCVEMVMEVEEGSPLSKYAHSVFDGAFNSMDNFHESFLKRLPSVNIYKTFFCLSR